MKRTALSLFLLMLLIADQAHAFIFTDLIAKVQRIEMMLQASEYIRQLDNYRKEFDLYKNLFNSYYQIFHGIYRRMSVGEWPSIIPTNWTQLKDHNILIWKTFDEPAWQSQVLALKISPLYATNPDYQAYADSLIRLSEEQVIRLKREEADLIKLQAQDVAHHDDLERFKNRNAQLAIGRDVLGEEIPLSQQIALTNAILLEIASIQAETKVVEQRLLTDQKEERNIVMRMKQLEIEAQKGDLRNLDRLLALTKTK